MKILLHKNRISFTVTLGKGDVRTYYIIRQFSFAFILILGRGDVRTLDERIYGSHIRREKLTRHTEYHNIILER